MSSCWLNAEPSERIESLHLLQEASSYLEADLGGALHCSQALECSTTIWILTDVGGGLFRAKYRPQIDWLIGAFEGLQEAPG